MTNNAVHDNVRRRKPADIIRPIIYLLPGIIIFAVFIVYPICYNIYLSTLDWNMVSDKTFVGFRNYTAYLTSVDFRQALLNTVGYLVILLFFCFLLPYGVAYVLGHVIKKGSKLYRALLFFPSLLSLSVAAVVFMWVLNSVNGPVALMLAKFGLQSPNWFKTPRYVIFAIGITVAWRAFGYNLIVYLGAIVDVPTELIEAARLDNASNWQIFTRIVVPLTSPTALFVFIMSVSYCLQYVVTPINILTQGGPDNASTNLSYQIYQYAFRFFQSGRAAAAAIITLLLFMTIVVWEKHLEKTIHYEI